MNAHQKFAVIDGRKDLDSTPAYALSIELGRAAEYGFIIRAADMESVLVTRDELGQLLTELASNVTRHTLHAWFLRKFKPNGGNPNGQAA